MKTKLEIKRMRLADIRSALYNPRKDLQPGDPEYEKIKRSIEEFGCVEPLVMNKRGNRLIGGHQRLKILLEKGVKEFEVSVVDLDEKKERALNIALNKIQGEWDFTKLADLLVELDDGELDLSLTGFDDEEIEKLLTSVPEFDKPEVEFAEELLEQHNFIVLYFDNDIDWIQAQTLFDLKRVESKHALKHWGVGRVMRGAEAIQKIREALRDGN